MEFMIGHQKHQEQLGATPHRLLSGTSRKPDSSTGSGIKEEIEGMENHSRA
jgi:hypothetical protein